jgi:hypothetical protein
MDDLFKDQYDSFFKDFKGLAQRMERVFPDPDSFDKPPIEDKIEFEFVCVTQQKDLRENDELVKLFFENLYDKDECFFSGVRTCRRSVGELLAQVPDHERTADVCTFFVIGFLPSIDITSSPDRPLTGCIVHYFTSSRTMLIESVWISSDLPEMEFKSEEENDDKLAVTRDKQKTVLTWLLTYNGPLSGRLEKRYTDQKKQLPRKRTSGLYKLVDKVENEGIHAPGSLVVRNEREVKGQITVRRHVVRDRVAGIFHETLDPVCMVESHDDKRQSAEIQSAVLRAFHDAGAKFLKFGYQQPSYGSPVCKHLLLTFSQVVRKPDYITLETGIVMAFIVDYAKYLNPEYDAPLGNNTVDSRYKRDLHDCWNFSPWSRPGITGGLPDEGGYFIPENNKALFEARFSPHGTVIYLNNVPRIEAPRFSYRRASISFEITVDEDYFPPQGLDPSHVRQNEDTLFCPLMHSTETDLFAYRYQSTPPYFSSNYGSRLTPVLIGFPLYSEFISEGRKEIYFRLPEPGQNAESLSSAGAADVKGFYHVKMLAGVSYTYFLASSLRVWHLVLRPLDDTSALDTQISELELIKLMRFFSGSQEFESEEQRRDSVRQIKFQVLSDESASARNMPGQMSGQDNLIELLAQLTGVTYKDADGTKKEIRFLDVEDHKVSLRNVSSGVVQIDTGNVTSRIHNYDETGKLGRERYDADDFLGFYGDDGSRQPSPTARFDIREMVETFYRNLNENKIEAPDEAVAYSVEDYADYVFKAYCGMSLGIFDYDRMGLQEIDDTLVPLPNSKTKESFLVIHRGVLAMFGNDDDVLNSFWATLGLNPYNVIPSAVLAHNDYVVRDAEARLAELRFDDPHEKSKWSISQINFQRNYINRLLNRDILGDVFQYKTEQELYKEGMARRGIERRITDCRLKLEQLDKRIESMHKERTASYENVIELLLAVAALTGVIPLLKDSEWVTLDNVQILMLFMLFFMLWFAKLYFGSNNYASIRQLFQKILMQKYIGQFRKKYFSKSANVKSP